MRFTGNENDPARQCVVPGPIACWLAYALIAGRGGTAPAPEPESASDPASESVIETEAVAIEDPAATQPTELVGLELEQGKRQRAAEKSENFRGDLQYVTAGAWSRVLASHWPAFTALRQKAADSPHGQTPCTLCDGKGKGHMDHCVLCQNSGKCPTCSGTGKAAHGEYCPTCLGKGSCYLCRGSKRMTCPFCDDGTVDVKTPVPPGMLPLH